MVIPQRPLVPWLNLLRRNDLDQGVPKSQINRMNRPPGPDVDQVKVYALNFRRRLLKFLLYDVRDDPFMHAPGDSLQKLARKREPTGVLQVR